MKLRTKIIAANALSLGSASIAIAVAIIAMFFLGEKISTIESNNEFVSEFFVESTNFQDWMAYTTGQITAGREITKKDYENNTFDSYLQNLRTNDDKLKELTNNLLQNFANAEMTLGNISTDIRDMDLFNAERRVVGEWNPLRVKISTQLREVVNHINDNNKTIVASLQRQTKTYINIIICIAAVSVIASLVIGVILTRSITKPIFEVVGSLVSTSQELLSVSNQVCSVSTRISSSTIEAAASLEETSSSLDGFVSTIKRVWRPFDVLTIGPNKPIIQKYGTRTTQ